MADAVPGAPNNEAVTMNDPATSWVNRGFGVYMFLLRQVVGGFRQSPREDSRHGRRLSLVSADVTDQLQTGMVPMSSARRADRLA